MTENSDKMLHRLSFMQRETIRVTTVPRAISLVGRSRLRLCLDLVATETNRMPHKIRGRWDL